MSMLDDIFLPLAEDAICASHPATWALAIMADGVEVLTPWSTQDGSDG